MCYVNTSDLLSGYNVIAGLGLNSDRFLAISITFFLSFLVINGVGHPKMKKEKKTKTFFVI